jgi:hypothetical protein
VLLVCLDEQACELVKGWNVLSVKMLTGRLACMHKQLRA